MRFVQASKERTIEAIIYPLLLLLILWCVFLIDRLYYLDLYKFGVKPQTIEGLKGIFFMPFIHSQKDYSHIINNSVPIFILLSTLIYFYREIAIYVVLFIWLGSGFILWYMAENPFVYHIGISGIIYGLFGFLLLSGFFTKYLPLQAISLFVAFVYGSMIWGIFPTEERISWEGHLAGFLIGLLLAVAFRKKGPRPPKYRYEIEQEMGIEPPDFEGEWKEKKRILIAQQEELKKSREKEQKMLDLLKENESQDAQNNDADNNESKSSPTIEIKYHYVRKNNKKESEE